MYSSMCFFPLPYLSMWINVVLFQPFWLLYRFSHLYCNPVILSYVAGHLWWSLLLLLLTLLQQESWGLERCIYLCWSLTHKSRWQIAFGLLPLGNLWHMYEVQVLICWINEWYFSEWVSVWDPVGECRPLSFILAWCLPDIAWGQGDVFRATYNTEML